MLRAGAVLDVVYRDGAPGLGSHRGTLFHTLWQAVQARAIALHTSAAVLAVPLQGQSRVVQTSTQVLGPFDLVIDASGAGSVLSPLQSRPIDFGAIWGHVPWPKSSPLPQNRLTQRYFRAERIAGVLPSGAAARRQHAPCSGVLVLAA
jgi:hypothetical protein